jgi:hypothetical protein
MRRSAPRSSRTTTVCVSADHHPELSSIRAIGGSPYTMIRPHPQALRRTPASAHHDARHQRLRARQPLALDAHLQALLLQPRQVGADEPRGLIGPVQAVGGAELERRALALVQLTVGHRVEHAVPQRGAGEQRVQPGRTVEADAEPIALVGDLDDERDRRGRQGDRRAVQRGVTLALQAHQQPTQALLIQRPRLVLDQQRLGVGVAPRGHQVGGGERGAQGLGAAIGAHDEPLQPQPRAVPV